VIHRTDETAGATLTLLAALALATVYGVAGLMGILVAISRTTAISAGACLVSGIIVPALAITKLLLPSLRRGAGLLLRLLPGIGLKTLRLRCGAALQLRDKLAAIRLSGVDALILALAPPPAAALGLAHPMLGRVSACLKHLVLTADSARLYGRHCWSLGDLALGHVLL
jgi:hypothetical protein